MIRPCTNIDMNEIADVINDAAEAYRGVIPDDRWHDPYMSLTYLAEEIEDNVIFHGYTDDHHHLLGVIGIQDKGEVSLIRHAYVRTFTRRKGIGSKLLKYVTKNIEKPLLVGTWKKAVWAISFYEKHGFKTVGSEKTVRLLSTYWSIPARQVETSIVLANDRWK